MKTSDTLLNALGGCEPPIPKAAEVDTTLLRRAIQGLTTTHPRSVICALIAAGEYGKITLITNQQTADTLHLMVDGCTVSLDAQRRLDMADEAKKTRLYDDLRDSTTPEAAF